MVGMDHHSSLPSLQTYGEPPGWQIAGGILLFILKLTRQLCPFVTDKKNEAETWHFPRSHLNLDLHSSRCILLSNHSHFCLLHYAVSDWQEKAKCSTSGSPVLTGVVLVTWTPCSQLPTQQWQATFVRHVTVPWAFSNDANHFCGVVSPSILCCVHCLTLTGSSLWRRWFYHPCFCKGGKQKSKSQQTSLSSQVLLSVG